MHSLNCLSTKAWKMTNYIGKIQYVSQPALPAKCICCGNDWKGKEEYMIDFQISLDDYGAVLFCEACAKELASLVSIEAVESRNEQIKNLQVRIQEVQEENVRLNTALDSILNVRPNLGSDNSVSSDTDEPASDEGE